MALPHREVAAYERELLPRVAVNPEIFVTLASTLSGRSVFGAAEGVRDRTLRSGWPTSRSRELAARSASPPERSASPPERSATLAARSAKPAARSGARILRSEGFRDRPGARRIPKCTLRTTPTATFAGCRS
jgi:hypothetical protein